jgi:hypothetical protein
MDHPKPLRWFFHMFGVRYWRKSEIDAAYLKAKGLMQYFDDTEKVYEAMKYALPRYVKMDEEKTRWLTEDFLRYLTQLNKENKDA